MSGQLARLNLQSRTFIGDQVFPKNPNRGYFFIVFTTGSGSVSFGNGGGQVPLANLQHYEPYVCPTGEITVTAGGDTFVVVSNAF